MLHELFQLIILLVIWREGTAKKEAHIYSDIQNTEVNKLNFGRISMRISEIQEVTRCVSSKMRTSKLFVEQSTKQK